MFRRYTSVPPAVPQAILPISPSPQQEEAHRAFHRFLYQTVISAVGSSASQQAARNALIPSAPCLCATLRPYQSASGLVPSSASDPSTSSPSWFYIPHLGAAAVPPNPASSTKGSPGAANAPTVVSPRSGGMLRAGGGAVASRAVAVVPEPTTASPRWMVPVPGGSSITARGGAGGAAGWGGAPGVGDPQDSLVPGGEGEDGAALVSELKDLVGALAREYGRRPGAGAFLSEAAWPTASAPAEPSSTMLLAPVPTSSSSPSPPPSALSLVAPPSAAHQGGGGGGAASAASGSCRLQHAVASAVALLPAECR